MIDAKHLIRPPPPPPRHTATQTKDESLRKHWYRRKRLCCQSLGPGSGEAVSWMRGACYALRLAGKHSWVFLARQGTRFDEQVLSGPDS